MKVSAHTLKRRLICAAVLLYALFQGDPGKALAGPGGAGGYDMVEEAVRDMQWREKMERPRTPAPRQAVPGTMPQPVVTQPDLSGLPRQLPQGPAPVPPPMDPIPNPALTKPKLDDSPSSKPKLIKPRIGKAPAQEREPKMRPKLQEAVPEQRHGQTMQSNVMPVPFPQQTTASTGQAVVSVSPPRGNARRTKLIKPHLSEFTPDRNTREIRAAAPTQRIQATMGQPQITYDPTRYQPSQPQTSQLPRMQPPPPAPSPPQTMPAVPQQYYPQQYPQQQYAHASHIPQQHMTPPMPVQQPQPQPLLKPQTWQDRYPDTNAEQSRRTWRMMGAWD